ncbi:MAG: hypothetical protein FRX49_10363 [Trebouxia sp. A1-2]|nr:MAG: hypothetical protein FRX49_10363 [Trebouxia sp. A1-2]
MKLPASAIIIPMAKPTSVKSAYGPACACEKPLYDDVAAARHSTASGSMNTHLADRKVKGDIVGGTSLIGNIGILGPLLTWCSLASGHLALQQQLITRLPVCPEDTNACMITEYYQGTRFWH